MNTVKSQHNSSFLRTPRHTFFYMIRPWRMQFAIQLVLIVLGNACAYGIPFFFKHIADIMAASGAEHTWQDFQPTLVFIVIAYLFQEACWRTAHILEAFVVVRVIERSTSELYSDVLKRPAAYFEEQFSGEITRRIEQITDGVKYFIEAFSWEIGWTSIACIMGVVLLFTVHPSLEIVLLVWLTLFLISSYFLLKKQGVFSQRVAETQADLSGFMVDSVSNIGAVHAFAAEKHERSFFDSHLQAVISTEKPDRWFFIVNKFHQGTSIVVLGISMVYMSVYLFLRGEISLGDFVIVTTLIANFGGIVWTLGDTVARGIRIYGSLKNAVGSLELKMSMIAPGSNKLDQSAHLGVMFNQITFAYPNTDKNIFSGFSLTIQPGEKVGLVGKSGSGKSTLVKLLLRYYDPQAGTITTNNSPTSNYTLESLRSSISFVPQDTTLFHRSLLENIRYAKPDATIEEVIDASKRAHAHEFIRSFLEGYNTRVGERGVKLSGGQRQRIALARAILKNAPILVLDEATSALDSESEELVQQSLYSLFSEKTVIAIAHRLSTLRAMDKIIVLEEGKIIESGTPHDLLIKSHGAFKEMWEHQRDGFVR